MNILSRFLTRRAAMRHLQADQAHRYADMAQYRERRSNALPPTRKAHIDAILGGYIRPRKSKDNTNV